MSVLRLVVLTFLVSIALGVNKCTGNYAHTGGGKVSNCNKRCCSNAVSGQPGTKKHGMGTNAACPYCWNGDAEAVVEAPVVAARTFKNCDGAKKGDWDHGNNCKNKGNGNCCKPKPDQNGVEQDAYDLTNANLAKKCQGCYKGSASAHVGYFDILEGYNAHQELRDEIFYDEAFENYEKAQQELEIARDMVRLDEMQKEIDDLKDQMEENEEREEAEKMTKKSKRAHKGHNRADQRGPW
eukprot:170519_1